MDNKACREEGSMSIALRYASTADAAAINEIFGYYIENTVVSYNTANKTIEERTAAIKTLMCDYPFLIAEDNGRILGFTCAEPVRPQAGYRYCAELTIYLHPDAPKHSGIGRMLYERLLSLLKEQGIRTVYAVISGENNASVAFHESFGFSHLAVFPKSGYKHGRWLDTIWMQKTLNPFDAVPNELIPFSELNK